MSRKGGQAETECKKKLIAEYGQHNVFKIAIGGAVDFIIVKEGRLILAVECKESHSKKYYPLADEKNQFTRIKAFCDVHNIKGELWIKYVGIKGRPLQWSIEAIDDYCNPSQQNLNTL